MSSGAPTLSLATTQLSYTSPTDDPAFNPFADATAETRSSKTGTTGYAGPYSANTPSTSVLRPRRRGSDSLLGRAPLSPTTHARAQTLDISAPSPSRPVQSLQRRRSDYTNGNGDGAGDVREEEGGEDADHPLRRRSSSRSVRSVASTKPRLRAALAATRESAEFEDEREARRGREAKRRQEGQRAVLVHQVRAVWHMFVVFGVSWTQNPGRVLRGYGWILTGYKVTGWMDTALVRGSMGSILDSDSVAEAWYWDGCLIIPLRARGWAISSSTNVPLH